MQWYILSVQEVVLEVNRHQWCVLSATKHLANHPGRHLLTVVADLDLALRPHVMRLLELDAVTFAVGPTGLLHMCPPSSSLLLLSCLTLFVRTLKSLLGLNLRLNVCRVYIVIDVTLIISHGRLITREAPIAIDYEFVLVDTSLEGLEVHELVRPSFLHGDSLRPFGKGADK